MVISHIGLDQRVLVICVKFSNEASTRLPSAQAWVNILNPQINLFYSQATYRKTSFVFETVQGGPSDGWFQLPYPNTRREGFFVDHLQDAIDLVDQYVDFSNYHRFLVIANGTSFFGQASQETFEWWRTSTGSESWFNENGTWIGKRQMTPLVISEWEAGTGAFDSAVLNVAHELGHNLGVKEHYGTIAVAGQGLRNVITNWSIMDNWNPLPIHFLGWSKYERGWLESFHVQTIGPPLGQSIDTLIDLWPQEIQNRNDTQLILIPFTSSSPFHGYVIENRQRLMGDDGIPKEGVLISLIDDRPDTLVRYLVLDNQRFPGDTNRAALELGDTFHDAQRNISISVENVYASRVYGVRIQYPLPANARPDPMIIPWGAPPYETVDLWIDSEKNGWDTYKYIDGTGNPVGNGDDPWLNRDNRVNVRVRNVGPGDAANVLVRVFVNQPPGIGDPGSDWQQVGTSLFFPHIAAGNSEIGYVLWMPTTIEHSCVKAEIQISPDELNPNNNIAQENIAAFETSSSSPWKPVRLKVQVYNPSSTLETPVRFHIRDLPLEWGVELDPPKMTLKPGEKSSVAFTVYPAGPPTHQPGDRYRKGFLGKPKLEAWVPFEDTFILLGGVESWVRLVEKTSLSLKLVKTKGLLLTMQGTVKPGIGMATVAIEFQRQKKRFMHFVKTDKKGNYTFELKIPSIGTWVAQAFFDGSSTLAKAESKVLKLEVLKNS